MLQDLARDEGNSSRNNDDEFNFKDILDFISQHQNGTRLKSEINLPAINLPAINLIIGYLFYLNNFSYPYKISLSLQIIKILIKTNNLAQILEYQDQNGDGLLTPWQ